MNSPGLPDSFHSPTTSTCTKFISEGRECWLENVDHIPNLIPFLKQNPPVDVQVFHLVLAWDEKDKFTRFYGFLFLFRLEFVILGELEWPAARVLSVLSYNASEALIVRSTKITPGTSLTQSREHKFKKKRTSNLHVLEHKSTCRQISCTHTVVSNKLNLWENKYFLQL